MKTVIAGCLIGVLLGVAGLSFNDHPVKFLIVDFMCLAVFVLASNK
jgi:uncharacterized membrane protein YfcA